ncbi:YbdD/YjiX family protein [Methylococcaceae bacterium WWC4]|uniref:YbdD/YjiX family protein n=1 Tax=Methylomonas sp. CM2 TaxID=3417647 RepID=UPI00143BB988|nr:YbdD/YjiX family protein [Methylococcaceae bacterium WWC4]
MARTTSAGMLRRIWEALNGETAYRRYLQHWQTHHADSESAPLSRKAFFAAETRRKWSGVKRCC